MTTDNSKKTIEDFKYPIDFYSAVDSSIRADHERWIKYTREYKPSIMVDFHEWHDHSISNAMKAIRAEGLVPTVEAVVNKLLNK